jgi:hypothetical protein
VVDDAARSAAQALRLSKQFASEAQMGEAGVPIAGAGTRVPLRDASRIVEEHGGKEIDWVKKASSPYTARDGTRLETHWLENVRTGERVEIKSKIFGRNE